MSSLVEPPQTFITHLHQCRAAGVTDLTVIFDTYSAYIDTYRAWIQYGEANLSSSGSVRSHARDNHSGCDDSDGGGGVEVFKPEGVEQTMVGSMSEVPSFPEPVDELYPVPEASMIDEHRADVKTMHTGSLYKIVSENILTTLANSVPWFFVGACQMPTVLSRLACVPNPRKLAYSMQLAALSGYDAECVPNSHYAGVVRRSGAMCVGAVFVSRSTVEEEHIRAWIDKIGGAREVVKVWLQDQGMEIEAVAISVAASGEKFDFRTFVESEAFSDYLVPMDDQVLALRRQVFDVRAPVPFAPVIDVQYSSDTDKPPRLSVLGDSVRYNRERVARLNRAKRLTDMSEESSDYDLFGTIVNAEFPDGKLPVGRILSSTSGTHKIRSSAQLNWLINTFNATSEDYLVMMRCDAQLKGAKKREGTWFMRRYVTPASSIYEKDRRLVDSDGQPSLSLQYCLGIFNSVSRGSKRYIVIKKLS
nr:MAG: hypothetical protein [Aspergillus flavus virga-like virus 1]